ncbi:MAG TPA: PASTA domain-containing protein [Terriglobales bacterium]|nr:PASTA domain-containing protein [Terriglobales bacterium]
MRRFFRWLLRALVLAVVFIASALTAMRFAIHGRQTQIPKVVGLSKSQASRLLADRGLVLEEGDRYFSSDVAPGKVMSQAPAPGVQVRRGWHVRVAESMGPQRVIIPDLIGNSERAAEINIRRRGLELGSVANASIPGAPGDQIVAQSPPANAVNVSEPKISILMAAPGERPSFVMPDLVGQKEDAVIDTIVNAGLRVAGIATQANPPASPNSTQNAGQAVPPGTRMVVKTTPAAGQRVWQGQGIALQVTQ